MSAEGGNPDDLVRRPPGKETTLSMPPTWTDVEHQHTDITLVIPVSEALLLKNVLPQIVQAFDERSARNPEDRGRRREVHAVIDSLAYRLREGLRPFDVPGDQEDPGRP
jgi:hypothetical protein